jgi:hypothetical protein
VNTIDFVVNNADAVSGFTGLRVDITSATGAIPLGTAPHIAVQPVGGVATHGSSFVLAVGASGSGPLSYQWFKGEFGRLLVSSNIVGPATAQDVFSLTNGEFYLDGERFAEISFNKFDLFWALRDELFAGRELKYDNPMVLAQEQALINLKSLGFRSIRVFAWPWGADSDERALALRASDKMVQLCEKHEIGLIWSLSCAGFTDNEEHLKELVSNRDSRNRQIMNQYLDLMINRYKSSPAVLVGDHPKCTT